MHSGCIHLCPRQSNADDASSCTSRLVASATSARLGPIHSASIVAVRSGAPKIASFETDLNEAGEALGYHVRMTGLSSPCSRWAIERILQTPVPTKRKEALDDANASSYKREA